AIMGGKVVRTIRSDIDQVQIYDNNPLDLALEFENNGIKYLHLVDLDGAKARQIVNYNILEMLSNYTNLQIDYTGGITRDDDIRTAFECGASHVTAATVAVHEREKFYSWMITYGGEKVILAADSLDGVVRTKGWKKNTGIDLMELLEFYCERGIRYVKTTEIGRNGTLEGPNFELYKNIKAKFPELSMLASGGIRSVEDIDQLETIGVNGVIIGKSFYDGKIKLKDLQKYTSSVPQQ
ncbi:MAG TPA: 1-(5-phosphoribosyl)-5-((5-phosphoribosylamino)methylideneamino)imidazole-4-carboxamide isomerase, partial [Microscillaceae bacterium]|nr:1-(5-phosphoribosyl)-5-((5-phosphoribosylamino)methylideneamino)imidazole-4-carboxamide isomerase [Microscillaceae bacterium]